jgi:hypothetical protein
VSRPRMVVLALAVSLLAAALPAVGAQAAPARPSHVVFIVLDQARPDTITRYGMENVQELQRNGKTFPNAIVGDMAAETVVSHNVITSGLLPKHMGWSNELYRDEDGVLGPAGGYYVTSSMSCNQFKALIAHGNYPKVQDYLDSQFGESSRFASFTQKRTSACTSGQTRSTDPEDIIMQIRGSGTASCDGRSGWRAPEYANGTPPPYFAELADACNPWQTWQAAGAYGTGGISPANIYPLDGDRFVPGKTPGHVGGDTWSANAAIRMIESDSTWHGMMVSLGGIDKMGHMWGPEDQGEPGSSDPDAEIRHLPFVAKNADAQVGRIVDALEAKGILDETLIVVTADHAAQTGRPFLGDLNPVVGPNCGGIRSDCNWYYGTETGVDSSPESYREPSPAVQALADRLAGNLAFSYQDTQVAAYLNDTSLAKKREAAAAVLDMPGVMASYYINGAQNDYTRFGTNHMTGAERAWFVQHSDDLVDTMANRSAPDVVGITRTNVTYGVVGDHGGSQKLVQNIPMVFYGPGVSSKDSNREIRQVDILPTVLKAMGIPYDPSKLDGRALRLAKPQG